MTKSLVPGGATLAIGQIAFATVRSPRLRAAIGLLYAVPATIAGYHATLGLAHIGVPAEGWREAFAVVGAILIGGTAWVRMRLLIPPNGGRQVAGGPASLSPAGAIREGVSQHPIVARLDIGARGPLSSVLSD